MVTSSGGGWNVEEVRLTPAEWEWVQRHRNVAPTEPKNQGRPLMSRIPKKLSETGAQMAYLGAFGLVATGVIAINEEANRKMLKLPSGSASRASSANISIDLSDTR